MIGYRKPSWCQQRVLLKLTEHGPLTFWALSDMLKVRPEVLAYALLVLERKGRIVRRLGRPTGRGPRTFYWRPVPEPGPGTLPSSLTGGRGTDAATVS